MLLLKSQSLAGFRCSAYASGSRLQLILWSLWSLNTTNFHFHFGRKEQYQPIPKIAGLSEIFPSHCDQCWALPTICLCVLCLCSTHHHTAEHCLLCVVDGILCLADARHCVCVRFPAPLMPVNRELVGRGQFLKYRHRPML